MSALSCNYIVYIFVAMKKKTTQIYISQNLIYKNGVNDHNNMSHGFMVSGSYGNDTDPAHT